MYVGLQVKIVKQDVINFGNFLRLYSSTRTLFRIHPKLHHTKKEVGVDGEVEERPMCAG